MPINLWQPGQSGNPAGRLRGSRNKLSEEVICALLRDFRKHGEKAIAKVRRTQPAAYLKVLALLVPKEMKVERSQSLKSMTDEELDAAIDAVRAMIAAGDGAKIIEGTAEAVALPAPDVVADDCRRRPNKLMAAADTAIGGRDRRPRKCKAPSPVGA
jgi:Family of unknown function (DUF5681)